MSSDHGIIVYEIIDGGNILSGTYTNEGLYLSPDDKYLIDCEIARKIIPDNGNICGRYECNYTESIPAPLTGEACFLIVSKKGLAYKFEWKDAAGTDLFIGLGLMAGQNHVAVSYT